MQLDVSGSQAGLEVLTEPVLAGGYLVRIERVLDGSQLRCGAEFGPFRGSVSIGRSRSNDIHLCDETISGRHVELGIAGDQLSVSNLSRHGTTFLNGERLSGGDMRHVGTSPMWIQVGRALLSVYAQQRTVPVSNLMPLPERRASRFTGPLLSFSWIGTRVEVRCAGHPVPLYPTAARVLARLCEDPPNLVHHSDLEAAADPDTANRAGGATLAQLLTQIRRAFEECIDNGWLDTDVVRGFLAERPQGDGDDDVRALLRSFIESVRGVGYRIWIPPEQVQLIVV